MAMLWRRAALIGSAVVAMLLATLVVAASGPAQSAQDLNDPPTPLPSRPTGTPFALPPPPRNVPEGWQVYRAHHFALAYPPGWAVHENVAHPRGGSVTDTSVSFDSPNGTRAVVVSELEWLDDSALQQVCARPGERMSYQGLPVISTRTAYALRSYVFASAGGIVYTLLYDEALSPSDAKALYTTILGTFRPEYAAPACRAA